MNNGVLTLREAIDYVNQTAIPLAQDAMRINTFGGTQPLGVNDKIIFDPSLNGQTITLLSGSGRGRLDIAKSVTIDGTDGMGASRNVTISANNNGTDHLPRTGDGFTIMSIVGATGTEQLEINSLTFSGSDTFASDVIGVSYANLTLKNVTLTGNNGGAMIKAFESNVTVENCTISGNFGLGIDFDSQYYARQLNVVTSTISGNKPFLAGGTGITIDGGGISIRGDYVSAEIQSSTITGNERRSSGGGVSVLGNGTFDVVETIISGNKSTTAKGGGFYARLTGNQLSQAILSIDRSMILGNSAQGSGGGLFVLFGGRFTDPNIPDKAVLSNSTLSGNQTSAGPGGGAYICTKFGAGRFDTVNATFSDNQALHATDGKGGGLFISRETGNQGIVSHLKHLTITNNRATNGGGLFSSDDVLVQTFVDNTIISGNFNHLAPPNQLPNNVGGNIENTSSFNLFGTGGGAVLTVETLGAGNILNNDTPKLGPLVYNGGPVFLDGSRMLTHAPIPTTVTTNPGSLTINAGNTNPGGFPDYDQRGNPWSRVVGGRIDIGAVEWKANALAGDYNFNGVVDAPDYNVWRDTLGSLTDLRADGLEDGKIDQQDYVIWKNAFGMRTGRVPGDGSGNGAVDFADYLVWSSTFGSTTDLRADHNEDGIVDDADYGMWFDMFGSTMEVAQFGLLWGLFDPDAPPAVVGFALSFPGDAHVDFAGRAGSGEQLRSVPLNAATTVSITFSQDVVVTQGALAITNLDGASPTVTSFAYDPAAQTATWTFAAALADGRYVVQLSDTVESLDGKALDGEFFNPTKLSDTGTAFFPSGDGDEGGEFRFRFTVLVGDDNHDNIYGTTNYQNWHSTEPGMIIVSTTADDYDADLSFGDVSLREAVNYANLAGVPIAIQLPAGRYTLTRVGTEGTDTAYNDLDVLSLMTIVG